MVKKRKKRDFLLKK